MDDLRIKFLHLRNTKGTDILPNGGVTVAYVVDGQYNVLCFSKAKCHVNDHYNKRVGRVKAQGRLRSQRYYQDCPANLSEEEFIQAMVNSN